MVIVDASQPPERVLEEVADRITGFHARRSGAARPGRDGMPAEARSNPSRASDDRSG